MTDPNLPTDEDDAIPLPVADTPTRPEGIKIVTPGELTDEAVARFESALGESLSAGQPTAVALAHAVSSVLRYGVAVGSAQQQGLVRVEPSPDEKSPPEGGGEGGSEDPAGLAGPST